VTALTLFRFHPQFRETAAIFRLLQSFALRWGLAEGRVFRWFAANIPMDLLPASRFRGDLDIIACLRSFPSEPRALKYLTWEVKVALVDKLGRPKSLKRGKTREIVQQLRIHRQFGAPEPCLLEMFVCEDGPVSLKHFPSPTVFEVIRERAEALVKSNFGYKILPFQHGREGDEDVGTFTIQHPYSHIQTASTIVRPMRTAPTGEFLELMATLDGFAESRKSIGFHVIVFCRACKRLGSVSMKGDAICPTCGSWLIAQ
jgi:hypothetical protein